MPTNAAEKKRIMMTEAPLGPLIIKLSIPTIISMLITSFYNMADTYFVGQLNDPSATGAVGVIFSLMGVLQAIGFGFGHGSGNFISRKLGAGDTEQANIMASVGFFSAFLAGVVIAALCSIFSRPLVFLLGSTETIADHAQAYVQCLMPGVPFLMSGIVINNQLRYQGSAMYAMVGITAGALLNVALDPLFIFTFGMGVSGAALATSISQSLSFVLLLLGTLRGGNIRYSFHRFKPTLHRYATIFTGGLPTLARQGLNSVSGIVLNLAAGSYGDVAIAAMSIVTRVMGITVSAVIGFGQGFQPICGFNYGAGNYRRVRQCFWLCVRISLVILLIIGALAYLFAPQIVNVFQAGNEEVLKIGVAALRMQAAALPLFSFFIISNMMLQVIGASTRATLLSSMRSGLFLIPCLMLLNALLGLRGIEMSQAISDVLTFLASLPITLPVLRCFKENRPLAKTASKQDA